MSHVSPDFIVDGRRLRVLQELAARGSITEVAAALHLTPSAISQQIQVLARAAGVPLVERQGRGVRLTPQARVLLHHADLVAAQLERARRDLDAHADGLTGQVVIGALATAISGIVAPVLPELLGARPDVQISVREDEDDGAVGRLVAGDLDVLLFVRGDASPLDHDPRLTQRTLHRDRMRLLVHADHPQVRPAGHPVALALLAHEPFVADTTGTCAQVTRAACAQAGFTPDVRHRSSNWTACAELVASGSAVALVPTLAFATAPPGTRLLDLTDPVPVRTIAIAVRAGTEESPLIQPVLDALHRRAALLAAA